MLALTVTSPTTPSTLREQSLLELQYDGPIPAYALADLRRAPSHTFALEKLCAFELGRWIALAHRNLKAEQRRLFEMRTLLCAAHKRWRLMQCCKARRELAPFLAEQQRRLNI